MSVRRRAQALKRSALALGIAAVIPVLAQSPPDAGQVLRELRVAPALPPQQSTTIELPQQAPPSAQEGGARVMLQGVRLSGNETLQGPVFEAIVADYLGREVSLAELNALAQRITQHYRNAGYVVARAYLPQQEVKDGIVTIEVLEGLLGARRIAADAGVRGAVLEKQTLGLKPDAVLRTAEVERAALLLADVPGVESATATLAPGAATGTSDVEFELRASRRLSGSIELDNFGNKFTGRERIAAQAQLVNPGGWGELIGLRLVSSGSELLSARFNLQATPLRYGWKAGATLGSTQYQLGDAFADLDAKGRARTFALWGLYPLRRSERANAYVQLVAEYKDLQDRVLGDTTEKNSRAASVLLSADHRDQWLGGGVSSYTLALGAGTLDIDSAGARALDASTARSHGAFHKAAVSLLRLQRVSERLALYAGASAQWSMDNLDSSEKFALGGANGVRAYPQGEATGDRGYLATVELRYRLAQQVLGGDVELAAFYDQGEVRINARPWLPGEDNTRRLAGAGLGVTLTRRDGLNARLNVAAKTGREDAVSDHDKDVRAWVQVVKRF